ncbi:MAG: hypothetical protein AB7S74_13210 [Hyphomicrobium sp.]
MSKNNTQVILDPNELLGFNQIAKSCSKDETAELEGLCRILSKRGSEVPGKKEE